MAQPLPSIQPYISSLAGNGRFAMTPLPYGSTSSTLTTLALNSAYSYASGGVAVLSTFIPAEDGNLTDFWLRIDSFSGTWGSTDGVIDVEIRDGLNNSNVPGTVLTGSFTVTLNSSTTGWYKKTGLSIPLTAGKVYSVVIGDADGGVTNYATISLHFPQGNAQAQTIGLSARSTTTNGFTSGVSGSSQVSPCMVMKVGSLVYSGLFSTIASVASSTNEKGARFKLPFPAWMIGFVSFDTLSLFSTHTFKLYADGTAPGGSTLWSYTPPSITLNGGSSPLGGTIILPSASRYFVKDNTWYRFTDDPTSTSTVPRKATLGAGGDSDLIAAWNPLGPNFYWINESSGAWVEDTDAFPLIAPVFAPIGFPTVGC